MLEIQRIGILFLDINQWKPLKRSYSLQYQQSAYDKKESLQWSKKYCRKIKRWKKEGPGQVVKRTTTASKLLPVRSWMILVRGLGTTRLADEVVMGREDLENTNCRRYSPRRTKCNRQAVSAAIISEIKRSGSLPVRCNLPRNGILRGFFPQQAESRGPRLGREPDIAADCSLLSASKVKH